MESSATLPPTTMEKTADGYLIGRNKSLERWARDVIMLARREGIFPDAEPCVVCGEDAIAHHENYAAPLDVIWLCRVHHQGRHQEQMGETTEAIHVNLDKELKTWLWVKAAEQGKRPARVIEEAIRIMREFSDGGADGSRQS